MSLYRTREGRVTHADEVPYIKAVPNKRDAERAYTKIISLLSFEQVDDLGKEIEILRYFLCSR